MARVHVPGKVLFIALATGLAVCLALALSAQQPFAPQQMPAARNHPLDEPINWLLEAKNNYAKVVRNYTCTLVKQEKVRGVLQDTHVIMFSAKTQPFSVYMKWVAPPKFAGQEVVFVDGRNKNMMRVKAKGILGVGGFQSIDTNDRRVMEHSRHTILDAGLGNMIEENLKNLLNARLINKTDVGISEYKFDNRACLRIETVNREKLPQFYCHRSVLYLEKDSKYPMRLENYDWPAPGAQTGDKLEEFSFADLRFNVEMREDLFNK